MLEFLQQPWHWWLSGTLIATIMFFLLYFGQSFGFSSNLRTICAAAGAGRVAQFFDFNWKSQRWNLVFLVGAILGGYIAQQFLTAPDAVVEIAPATRSDLAALGFAAPVGAQPMELFSWEAAGSVSGFLILAVGGLLVGFGARYAGGCTSGHAISGLSDLQVPSLLAVVGFFIGGLAMTHLLFPFIF
jgi:hypothetical protein